MSSLHYEDVMNWAVPDVLTWLQQNNLEKFHCFVVSENIDGPSLIQLDKSRISKVKDVTKTQKENLIKLIKEMAKDPGKSKEKSKKNKSGFLKSLKEVNGTAAVQSSAQPPYARPPPPPPVDDEDVEFEEDPSEWDDEQDIYDNDNQLPREDVKTKGHRRPPTPPAPVDDNSDDGQDYVNPDEEIKHEEPSGIYEQETPMPLPAKPAKSAVNSRVVPPIPASSSSSQKPVPPFNARVPAPPPPPPPPPDDDEEQLYDNPDSPSTPSTPPPPPFPPPATTSKLSKLPPPPPPPPPDAIYEATESEQNPPPSFEYYETPDSLEANTPTLVSSSIKSDYETAVVAKMANTSKGHGAVPPLPVHPPQEKPIDKAPPARPPGREPKPPAPIPGRLSDYDNPEIVTPARAAAPPPPGGGRRGSVPCPSPPASSSPPQDIYEETDDVRQTKLTLPPGRRAQPGVGGGVGGGGGVRPALPVPRTPSQDDDDIYEPPLDETAEKTGPPPPTRGPAAGKRLPAPIPTRQPSEDEVYEETETLPVPKRNEENFPAKIRHGAPLPAVKLNSVALRDARDNLRKKPIPNFSGNGSTDGATSEIKEKFQEMAQKAQPPPPSDGTQKKTPPQIPATKHQKVAPEGPEPPRATHVRAPPGPPSVAETSSRAPVLDPNDISTQPWFFGDYDSHDAISLLKKLNADGTYLVRESKRSGHNYTLAIFFRGDTFNIPIRKRQDGKFALGSEKAEEHVFETVNDMIRFHRNNAIEVSKEMKIVGKVKLAKVAEK